MDPGPPPLVEGEVHLWWTRADGPGVVREDWLSDAERDRAARFRFEHLRRGFRLRQSFLRSVLARYQETDPAALEFRYGSRGKPYLKDAEGGQRLEFNLSHSEDWILIGVSRGLQLGVDVQARLPLEELEAMAQRILCDEEHAAFERLPSEAKARAFYRVWVRKEAVLKASGVGFYREPATLLVGLEAADPQRPLSPRPASGWDGVAGVRDLEAPAGYDAAVATLAPSWSVRTVASFHGGPRER